MSEPAPQTLQNHVRFDPWFHFVLVPFFSAAVIWSVVLMVRHPRWLGAAWIAVFLALLLLTFVVRVYAIKVQTRVIRLEERLRLHQLLSEPLRSRIPELTESQLVALRFASDAECAALVEQALTQKLSNAQIKKAITTWRPDYWRV